MLTLLQGIQTAFNANSTLASQFANGLEVAVALDGEALPLCVLTVLPPPPPMFQTGMDSAYVEKINCQFTVYSTNPDFVQSQEALLDATFNRKQITLTTDSTLLSRRNGGGNPYRDADAKTWRADYFYLFTVQRNS